MHPKGILIRTRPVCSSWANFGVETPVEQKISQRRAISVGWLCACFPGLIPRLPYHQQSVISWLGSSFLFDQIVIFRSVIKTTVVQFMARFYIFNIKLNNHEALFLSFFDAYFRQKFNASVARISTDGEFLFQKKVRFEGFFLASYFCRQNLCKIIFGNSKNCSLWFVDSGFRVKKPESGSGSGFGFRFPGFGVARH